MKLKINQACDLSSISVLPPRRPGGSGGVGASGSAAVGSQPQQHRSQPMSQQSSQGGGGSGGGSSLLHSQSQLSQGSLDENHLALHLLSPPRDQRFGLHDGSSKKVPSMPVSSASAVPEESQLQLAKISSNPVHRWNPSLSESRCQVPNEDVERKFQHLASSVHKMGMVLDSVQNDCMQLNRAMKEASLDTGSIQQKVVLLDNSIQKILKEQGDLKALVESITKSNSGQLDVLNSHSSKLEAISSALSDWPKQMQADLKQQQSDIFRIFTKEMEGIVRAIRSLSGRPAVMQMPADQSCTTNKRSLMNLQPGLNERPPVNQMPVATLVTQAPVASVRPVVSQTPVANGRSLMSQMPAANAKGLMSQTPAANGRPLMCQIPTANGKPQTSQIPATNGRCHTNQVSAPKVNTAPLVCPAKVAYPKPKTEQGKSKAVPQMLIGSGTRLMPKQEPVPNRKVGREVTTKKVPPVVIIIESDDESEGRSSCVILTTQPGAGGKEESVEMMREVTEESLQILRRARKRRRREMRAIVPVT
ncbi:hypothetical protein QOZ80_3BG0297490 [Eleusine coracana subsp. coracana]|nr:hypothetical protein QOZ80_3BG0297490 [Eleusine coracana subsp. coracana]